MNIKRELIALAVRVLAEKTSLVRQPDPAERFINSFFGGNLEPYEYQLARKIEADLDRGVAAAKRCNINRKFKKITQNF